ncbi:MAG: DUF1570 domain-containing protein [Pirellulaceae bacterium]
MHHARLPISLWLVAGWLAALSLAHGTAASAMDKLIVRRDGKEVEVVGQTLVTAQDGGKLLVSRDGMLWRVPPEELVKVDSDAEPFKPFTAKEMESLLEAELPDFKIHSTANYIVCYNTSRAYAQWCGALLERLYAGFTNYWKQRKFQLEEPEFPLVAVVFADKASYREYLKKDVGELSDGIIGYYNMRTNRVTMYDLTGVEQLRLQGNRGSAAAINAMLSRPEAERTVATIIHEATHQLAFNCGLQTRYADIPLWLSEGIAMYFESPDLKSRAGWRTIGAVNRFRLNGFRGYLSQRPGNSLGSRLADSKRVRDPRQADNAYHESWALTYFLIRQKPEQFLEYMRVMSKKPWLVEDDPETRLKEFQKAFGIDLEQTDKEFVRYMQRLR